MLLILLALLFLGLFALAIATDSVPSDHRTVAFAPAFYAVTVMVGLVISFLGFVIVESFLRRRGDPASAWPRTAVAVLTVVLVLFVIACVIRLPAVALGIAVSGVGVGIALLWAVRGSRNIHRGFWVLLWICLALVAIAAIWIAVTIGDAIG
ncbi:hypothetical protein ACFOJ6_09675 [Gordonia humi]|uniref:hypothetical protein n=1 Tax=Gordonia humi TaxID=686429 RepID=UPI0016079FDF